MTGIYSTMHRFMRFISPIAICLVFVPGWIHGQEEEGRALIYINNNRDVDTEIIDEYIDVLNNNLIIHGVNLEVTDNIQEANLILHLNYDSSHEQNEFRAREIEIELETRTNPDLPETSILYGHPEQPFNYIATEGDIIKSLSSDYFQLISTYIALYSMGECDAVFSIYSLINEIDTHPFGKVFDFFAGNCSLVRSEVNEAFQHLSYSASFTIQPFINDQHALVNLSWLYVTYDLDWNGFETWTQREETPIALIGYFECDRFEGPCWAGVNSLVTENATQVITVEKQIELITKRAQLYALTFDYDTTLADIDEAIAIAEENDLNNHTLAHLYTIRGEIIFLIYEWDRVEDNFTTAIELDPTYAPAYFQRGVLFYTMARREDALADFEMYLELDPDGIYTQEAQTYIDSIQIEIESLGG